MRFGVIAATLLLAACDVPTDLPKWNPRYAVPLESTTIPLAQLLPAGVTVSADGLVFLMSTGSLVVPLRLMDACVACRPYEGLVVTKPAFQIGVGHGLPLPQGVDSASIVGGSLNFRITNGWSFDPLRPGGAQTGLLGVNVTGRDARPLGFAVLFGTDHALPPGSSISHSLTFTGTPTTNPVLRLDINSPEGGPVVIDGQSTLTFVLNSGQLVATDVKVTVAQRQLTGIPLQLDLTGIDDFIIERVQSGKLVLTLDNEFAVRGTMTLSITGGLMPIVKTFTLEAEHTTAEVTFSEEEMESILGQSLVASLSGFVSTNGSVSLMPRSVFRVEPLLVLELGATS